ncbi:MAG: winged helix-turn-helix domain-containing protein [Chlamydiota bacterium]
MRKALFGTETNAKILFYLLKNKKCYPSELKHNFNMNFQTVNKGLANLLQAGILRSYYEGRTRLYRFDPKCYFLRELKALLKKLYKKLSQKEKDKYYENKRPKDD